MGIAQKVGHDFSEGVRSRGQLYFARGRVLIAPGPSGEVIAKVRGTTNYRVRLWLRGARLLVSCTCPYFMPEGVPCKHIWATVLTADKRGLLPTPAMRSLDVVPVMPRQRGGANGEAANGSAGHAPGSAITGPLAGGGSGFGGHEPMSADSPVDGGPAPARWRNGYGTGPSGPSYGAQPAGPSGYGPRAPQGPYGNPAGKHRPKKVKGLLPGPGGKVKGGGPVMHGPGHGHAPGYPQGPAQAGPKASKTPKVKTAAKRRLLYVVDGPATLAQNQVVVEVYRRERKPGTDRSVLKPFWYTPATAAGRVEIEDLRLLGLLNESRVVPPGQAAVPEQAPPPPPPVVEPPALDPSGSQRAWKSITPTPRPPGPPLPSAGLRRFTISGEKQVDVVERLCASGRCRLRRTEGEDDPPTLRWDDGKPWQFWLEVRQEAGGKRWTWRGVLHRTSVRMDLAEPLLIVPGLLILGNGRAARFDDANAPMWVTRLRHEKELIFLDEAKHDAMLAKLLEETGLSPRDLIVNLEMNEVRVAPRPRLILRTPRQNWGPDRLMGQLDFDYQGTLVPAHEPGNLYVSTASSVVIHRDIPSEQAATIRLFEMGFRESKDHLVDPGTLELPAKKMPQVVRGLVAEGWQVEAEGQVIQPPSEFRLNVTSGIDWFELDGVVAFGEQSVALPELMAAVARGEDTITLSDGTVGMLPEEWLAKYSSLAELGTLDENGVLRFGKSQAGLLDALLAQQPGVRVDEGFRRVRDQLHHFEGIEPLDAPEGFRGTLRPYQQEGLGWLDYWRRFGFGGILADDMGLGKTIQVLALLQRRKALKQAEGPTLAVVPRSLVFNWIEEAAKFTPGLKVLDYTGRGRPEMREEFADYDLIVTTYGTVRTDVAELANFEFDYVILDEAQAIKNSSSQAAKAARLLKGKHRLAISGTPIENHLGELWSIFEFLNPGMLGSAPAFKGLVAAGQDEGARPLLAKALKPFILRRTKAQVVKDLPEKTEQTLICVMEPAQRKLYEELKAHYRQALLKKGAAELSRSKIEVLEALLRLRQASCHPGLIDPARKEEASAKLDMLLPQLAEVVEEGHKVLVFSQFTSFLALVKEQLDKEGLKYEYLDGRTRNRADRVERFQTDPTIPIFLISLKAGGLGLNLTAAEYVYLLDPWWNPAVEAQAIDRSHRIGQTRNVFAYRLICRDTVEQKIVDLQQQKRELADAILDGDKGTILKSLTRDDLEYLLS